MKNDMPLILVFKIGVGKMPRDLAIKKINEIRKLVEPYDPDLKCLSYFIPVAKSGDVEIECLNPKLVTEEEYVDVKDFLNRTNKILEEWKMEKNS